MALPSSGIISLSDIQTEFGGSNPISLSEYYRSPNGLPTDNNTSIPLSGAISLSNFYGAVKQFAFTISANLSTAQNLRTLALAAGWNAADPVLVTIATGVVISSSNTGQSALTVSGSFPAGVILINNGYIIGQGGAGGNGGSWGNAGNAGVIGIDPSYQTSGAGGAAGSSVTGNSFITWLSTGTRLGPIA